MVDFDVANDRSAYGPGYTSGLKLIQDTFARRATIGLRVGELAEVLAAHGQLEKSGEGTRFVPNYRQVGYVSGVSAALRRKIVDADKGLNDSRNESGARIVATETIVSLLAPLLARNSPRRTLEKGPLLSKPVQEFLREKLGRELSSFLINDIQTPEFMSRITDIMATCGLKPACTRYLIAAANDRGVTCAQLMQDFTQRIIGNSGDIASTVLAIKLFAGLLTGLPPKKQISSPEVASFKQIAATHIMKTAQGKGESSRILLAVAQELGNDQATEALIALSKSSIDPRALRALKLPHRQPSASAGAKFRQAARRW
jgi:hypothetical protein